MLCPVRLRRPFKKGEHIAVAGFEEDVRQASNAFMDGTWSSRDRRHEPTVSFARLHR
jgi:hypothetical protein